MKAALKKHWFLLFVVLFTVVNLFVAFTQAIFTDPGLYAMYGQHLRWVYIDTPPLIAFITRVGTALLGYHAYTINLLSLFFVYASAYVLFTFAKHLYDKKLAQLITMVWLITPAILHMYFRFDWSYHNILSFLWIATLYCVYRAATDRRAIFIYLSAFFVYLGVLTQVNVVFLILGLLLSVTVIKKYRVLLLSKHTYIALAAIIVLLIPYTRALYKSNWLPIRTLFTLHYADSTSVFNLNYFWEFWNILLSEINLFLILGIIVLLKKYKQILLNNDLLYLLIVGFSVFLPFMFLSLHASVLIKFYLPFYFSFLLATLPHFRLKFPRMFKFAIWVNILLFLVDSWNVMLPQYGIGSGANPFYNRGVQAIAMQLKQQVKQEDLLLGCAKEPINNANMSNYLSLSTFAFYLAHKRTFALEKGYYIWQDNIESVLSRYKNHTLYYICLQPKPLKIANVQCGKLSSLSSTQSHYSKKYTKTIYVQKCLVH